MRDADGRRAKPTPSKREYALAYPAVIDDMDSCDADDEFNSDSDDVGGFDSFDDLTFDDFLIVSSNDQKEPNNNRCKDQKSSSATEDSTGLHIIENYFDTLPYPSYQRFDEVEYEGDEDEQRGPPAIRLNIPTRPCEPFHELTNGASTEDEHIPEDNFSLVLEQSFDLRESSLLQQEENKNGDDGDLSDYCPVASECFDDDWAFELEAAEEDCIAREEELAAAKTRHNTRNGTHLSPRSALRSTRSNRDRGRKVAFALKPGVFNE
ncbi:hypothetical protein PG996_000814 [Apiospora saccharicola]|uniref:Uncharacterized protein n=1 Tax=Apiospora saccharicola TaxID=335842 RepID=A0ABR1WES8_9PEZI